MHDNYIIFDSVSRLGLHSIPVLAPVPVRYGAGTVPRTGWYRNTVQGTENGTAEKTDQNMVACTGISTHIMTTIHKY